MINLRKILVVDDEQDLRAIANLSLRNIGKWQVTLAASGSQALEILEAERPDLVLLDVKMPELDGPETLRRLRALPAGQHLPVVFMTAIDEPEEHQRLLELGAAAIIVKPFAPLTLPQKVRQIVAQLAERGG